LAHSLTPTGLCLSAFHAIYPRCLALLYDASFTASLRTAQVEASCPNPDCRVRFEITRIERLRPHIKMMKKAVEWLLAKLAIPPDWIDLDISIQVKQVDGSCPANHRVGQTYTFNICLPSELCPATFHALFPYLTLAVQGLSLPWPQSGKQPEIHCPDHRGFNYQVQCHRCLTSSTEPCKETTP
jgi:uncharacterized repeat protein (TIGR04076 family)